MELDASHRGSTAVCSLDDYERFAADCALELQLLKGVHCVLIAGSVAKGDVVSGWSDLDIVVFYTAHPDPRFLFSEIRGALQPLRERYAIGLGIDIVSLEDFRATKRLGGRPLAMTFELAQYAISMFGPNPVSGSVPESADLDIIRLERTLGIAVEIHNWRRRAVSSPPNVASHTDTAKLAIKSWLRILKYDSNLYAKRPYTYQAALDSVKQYGAGDDATLNAYCRAVEMRRQWLQWAGNPNLASAVTLLEDALAKYPLRANSGN